MATTTRGHIEQLPSGSFRGHVYAGTGPVTGKPRRLKQTCPDEASAAAALGRLLAQADGDRFPNREATLGQALGKYLEVADLEVSTRELLGFFKVAGGPILGPVCGLGEPLRGQERPMPVLRHRLAIAGVITAAAVTVPAAASASGSGSPPGWPAPPQASAATASKSAARSQLIALAAAARISVSRTAMHQGDGDVRPC
jgi:hypothetical protein